MKRHPSCRLCHKLINSYGKVFGKDDSYSEHIAVAHPGARKWLHQERIASKEKLEFAIRTAFDIAPNGR